MIATTQRHASSIATSSTPLTRKLLAELHMFTNWLQTYNVKGFLGEVGWPCYPHTDAGAWNAVAHAYFARAAALRLPIATWVADGKQRPSTNILQQYGRNEATNTQGLTTATTATNVGLQYSRTGIYTNYHSQYIGSSTLLDGTAFSNNNPGTWGTVGTDCIYPSAADLAFLASRGVRVVRLSFRWERLYPTLGGNLNATELTRLQNVVTSAWAQGIQIILCPFSFASYWIGTDTMHHTEYKLTTDTAATVHIGHFTDFWSKLSAAFKDNPGIYAYDLMNEPSGILAISGAYGPNFIPNSTFESGAGGWSAGAATSIASSTTTAHSGTQSLAIIATTAGTPSAFNTSPFTITPGGDYTGSIWVSAGSVGRVCRIGLDWRTSGNVYINSAVSANVTDSTAGWVQIVVTGTAPPTAAKCSLSFKVVSAALNEVHYVDDAVVQASTNQSPQAQWQVISQSAVNAIRATGDTARILVPGYNYSHVNSWQSLHPTPWISDAANNILYEAHHYWDLDRSGRYTTTYAQALAAAQSAGY